MNKGIFFILIIILLSTVNTIAQKNITDSIESLLLQNKNIDTIKVNLLNDLAYKLYQINPNKTLKYANEAGLLANKLNYPKGKSESLRLIGIYNILRGNYSEALDKFQQSLDIALSINNKSQIAKSYNNIGLIYDFYEDYKKSLKYYKKSLDIDKQMNDKRGISICYSNIGLTYKTSGDNERALIYLQKALKIDKEVNDKVGIARVYNNIASIYSSKNNNKKALEFLKKSLKMSPLIGVKSTEAESYKDIAIIFFEQKNFKKAYYYSKKAYLIAKEIAETELLKESSEILAKSCSKLGLYKQAYKYYVIFKATNDSIYNDKNTKKIASIGYKYKYEQEKQILIAEQQKKDVMRIAKEKQQSIIKNSFLVGFILMIILALVIYISFLQKRKANKILSFQKKEIEDTNNELNLTNEELNNSLEIVNQQKEIIEDNHNNIQDSINYASRIQQALLPTETVFLKKFNSHFILFKPKDIVSGDFYYLKEIGSYIIVAVADCTGHGVPGAFLSMLGIAFLNEIVRKKEIVKASQILEELRKQIKSTLKDNTSKDGMDIALCLINKENNTLQFAGANNPLYIFRKNNLNEIKATKNPIGAYFFNEKAFKNNIFNLEKDDTLYMFSDGYIDQFGGKYDKKFMLSRFRKLLISIQNKTLEKQKEILNNTIEKWKGEKNKQIDDILILGIKI